LQGIIYQKHRIPPLKLQFLGATETVTGSKYLITHKNSRLLVDCGLYQGVKNLRLRNWETLPVDPATIDAVVLTHAHIDHSGFLPALINLGFRGKVYCSRATKALCAILLPDSGYLQEEDAFYANKYHFSKHSPALPLYTEAQGRDSLKYFQALDYKHTEQILPDLSIELSPNGHILGSCSVKVSSSKRSILFSGDVGRPEDPIMYPPEPVTSADFVVVESTYGNRRHEQVDAEQLLGEIINRTIKRGGIVLMPSFAVGRAQTMLFLLQQLKEKGVIPHNLPVYLNSPMAITATEIFCNYHNEHKLTAQCCKTIDQQTNYVRTQEESRALNNQNYPAIIISASGMASGGRVLHHLKTLAPDHRNSIVFLGFQAPGTRGENIVNGAREIKIHGAYHAVRAEVHCIDSLSAHGDYQEIIDWLSHMKSAPIRTFVTHGEAVASDAMRKHIKEQLGWEACVPEYLYETTLD
jgi:metallo-beta-lactamase family protein